ncbi:MAG: tail fiber domain-containing protein [Bacteroidota bacterium]
MKKILIYSLFLGTSFSTMHAQLNWRKGGNNFNPNTQTTIGTNAQWNAPFQLMTNNDIRMHINENNTFYQGIVPTSGFIGIGDDPTDVRSRLTITGTNNTFGFQGGGFRRWMTTGIFNLENSDNLYVGLKEEGFNRSDAIFAWGDDQNGNELNNARFIFSGASTVDGSCTNCPANSSGLDGREIMRMNPNGNIGVGPLFVQNNQPKSTMHMHKEGDNSNWLQVSNQDLGLSQNQVTRNDGIRLGVLGGSNNNTNGIGMLYNQENQPLLFSTNQATNALSATNTRDRMRITAVGTPTELPNGNVGSYNPGNVNGNRTRVSISHNPSTPVTRPLSLLHLGYNTGNALSPGATDGWRPWMDVGMFVSQGTDNMYFGLKDEGSDRFDAVINWGDNQGALGPFPIGPDNLRFVFTSTTGLGSGDPVSTSADGLEMGRFEPTQDQNGLANSFGKLGVGDFNTNPLPVTHKLHVRGNGRFEYVPEDSTAEHIILGKQIDPNNPDDVALRRLEFTDDPNDVLLGDGTWGTPTGVGGVQGAHNGTSLSTINPDLVSFGQDVGDPANPGILLSDREVPMDGYNIEFNGIGVQNSNLVSFGQPNSITGYDDTKVHVYNDHEFVALTGYTDASNLNPDIPQYGISGYITNTEANMSAGVHGLTENGGPNHTGKGVFGQARNNPRNIGVLGEATGTGSDENTGGRFNASGSSNLNYGVNARVAGPPGSLNYAVYGSALPASGNTPPTGPNYAGFFDGDVVRTGTDNFTSDAALKNNIQSIGNATQIINQLNPINFDFDQNIYPQMHLADGKQYGFTAQDVEQILPELVKNEVFPPQFDSLGNVVNPQVDFKSLNYQAFIPILTKGMQEQNTKIDSLENELAAKDSLLNDVNDRLTQLENCLDNLLPMLCQINNSAIEQNDDKTQEALLHEINVELFDGENIILEQNIPNPFAERTVINYSIPSSVGEAKLIFYNNEGRMIREVPINERGAGKVNVFGAELSKGIYSYTLICDGEVISTKKMVKN